MYYAAAIPAYAFLHYAIPEVDSTTYSPTTERIYNFTRDLFIHIAAFYALVLAMQTSSLIYAMLSFTLIFMTSEMARAEFLSKKAKEMIEKLESEVKTLTQTNEELKETSTELADTSTTLKTSVKEQRRDFEEHLSDSESLHASLADQKRSAIESVRDTTADLKGLLAAKNDQLEELRRQAQESAAQNAQLTVLIEQLMKRLPTNNGGN